MGKSSRETVVNEKVWTVSRTQVCVYEFYATKHKNESAPCVLLGLLDLSKKMKK